ncbi:MAG: hypothetical protein ABIP39_14000 [Polyangiaceae bacterium]
MATKRSRKRVEIQFFPQSSANPIMVRLLGAVGALALGAGAWEQFGAAHAPIEATPYILAGGALAFGAAIWVGTSGDLIVRVGQGGVAEERAGVIRRIPWYQIAKITWDETLQAILVKGDDESGSPLTITVKVKSQPHAAASIVDLAAERAPKALDVSESAMEKLPKANNVNGLEVMLDAVQVVGKRCAKSNKVIAYEPDGRVCPTCERIYHKNSVPKKCACGTDLIALRHSTEDAYEGEDESDEEDDDAEEKADASDDDADEAHDKDETDDKDDAKAKEADA